MKTIWKYEFRVGDEQEVWLPKGAKILTVGVQAERPVLWALVDPKEPDEAVRIQMRGTGHPADGLEKARHLGTIFMHGGRLVFHVFEGGE